ncbi:MAG: glycosyltransferase family 4 protein [Terracidiphilus sp.]|nr:glycosyltransferase family 4 protein [Terracidiphilus sp.]
MGARGSLPRILFISEIIPRKPNSGGEMRCFHTARALRELGAVDVAILNMPGKTGDLEVAAEGEFPPAYVLDVEQRPNEGLLPKLRWTFNPGMDYPFGCGVEGEPVRLLRESLGCYDLIWFFNLRSADIFPNAPWLRSVVDIDDLPSTGISAALDAASGAGERLQAWRRLFAWRRREHILGKRFTVLSVCSQDDKRRLESNGVGIPIYVIPNGFDAPSEEPVRAPATPPRIGFVGLYDYGPNRDGIDWFVRTCWPLIRQQIPGVRLRLAGKDTHGALNCNDPQIDKLGWIEDADAEMASWSAMIVPIRGGGGTRIKIAHGFSRKCPVVSTTFGAYGYDVADGRELYLADTPEAFAQACIRTIREPESAAQMAGRAWQRFLENWTWDAIRPLVRATAEDCLRRSHASAHGA